MKTMGPGLLHDILDLLFPRCCANCKRRLAASEGIICISCNINLPRTQRRSSPTSNLLAKLFAGEISVSRAESWIYYHPLATSSRFIRQMKYHGQAEIAHKVGRMMGREFMDKGFFQGIDAIVPVPLSPQRLRHRGYNQSLRLVQGLSEISHIPVHADLVCRINTPHNQVELSHEERRENVSKAFCLNLNIKPDKRDCIAGKHILLVDDVITTGATLIAVAKQVALLQPAEISVLSVATTQKPF